MRSCISINFTELIVIEWIGGSGYYAPCSGLMRLWSTERGNCFLWTTGPGGFAALGSSFERFFEPQRTSLREAQALTAIEQHLEVCGFFADLLTDRSDALLLALSVWTENGHKK